MTTTLQTECLPVAHIVDDDEPFRQSLTFLLESSGWSTVEYDSAAAFLAADPPYPGAGCLILDIRMPRMNGLELYQELVRRGSTFPVLFMTGHGDVELAVESNVAVIATLNEQIDRLEKRLQENVKARTEYGLLTSVPGIGQVLV